MKHVVLATIAVLGWPEIAVAQDAMFQNLAGNLALIRNHDRIRENALDLRRGPSRRPHAAPYTPVASNTRAPAFPYVSTAASRRQAAEGLIARASQGNPAAAKEVAAEMARHDIFRIYDGLIASTQFKSTDASDVLASYLALGYVITHGTDTNAAQERAVRTQVEIRAGGESRIRGRQADAARG